MKKIININLSGRVIPIEDSAYEKLQVYIESLRRYFANEEGRDEIINDIESRIAELMNEKVRKGASAVTDADIDEIIASMGRPQDFDADMADGGIGSGSSTSTSTSGTGGSFTNAAGSGSQAATAAGSTASGKEKKVRSRLYRNTSDKFLGGVCSGIAAYLNVDPAIVRILFAIITFGGFGLGFLIYIFLWIILPTKDLEGYAGKRLYRNPDDKVVGGVAGGLAAYLNRETWLIRLIFVGPLALSIMLGVLNAITGGRQFDVFPNIVFGSLNGTLCLIYIVLWMVLPEANTNYEKMEMRGERVDVNSIRQNVKEEMDSMKDRMKDWGDELKESAQNFSVKAKEFANTRGKNFAREVGDTARSGGNGIGHAIGVLFKVFFLFIAGTIAFALFVGLIALLFGGIAWWPVNNFIWTSNAQQLYAWGILIFFLVTPLIGFITWIVRRLLKVRSKNSYLGWTFGFLWTLGWISLVLFASSMTKDFRTRNSVESAIDIVQPKQGKLILTVSQPELRSNTNFMWADNGRQGWDLTDDTLKLSHVNFSFSKSADSSYHVTLIRWAFGDDRQEAATRAARIVYPVNSSDSFLDLGNAFAIDRESKYRGQHVEIAIQVPVGKKIRFSGSVHEKLASVDIDWNREGNSRRWGHETKIRVMDSWNWESEVDYMMDNNGDLVDVSGRVIKDENQDDNQDDSQDNNQGNNNDGGYRYNGAIQDSERNNASPIKNSKPGNESLQERERRWKEEGERIKQEKMKDTTREPNGVSMDDADEGAASADFATPVNALVRFF